MNARGLWPVIPGVWHLGVGFTPGRRRDTALRVSFRFAGARARLARLRLPIPLPADRGGHDRPRRAAMVLLATLFYGIAFNMAVPLEERNALLTVWLRRLLAVRDIDEMLAEGRGPTTVDLVTVLEETAP